MSLSRQSKDALCDDEGALSQRTSVSNNLELKKLQLFGSRRKLALLLHSAAALFKDTHHNALLHQTHLYQQTNRKICAWDLIGRHMHTSSRWFVQPEQAWCIFASDGASHRDTHCLCGTCLAPSSTWLLWRSVLWPEAYRSLSSGFENLWKRIAFCGIVLVK